MFYDASAWLRREEEGELRRYAEQTKGDCVGTQSISRFRCVPTVVVRGAIVHLGAYLLWEYTAR